MPPAVAAWCRENGWGETIFAGTLSGGMISRVSRWETGDGRSLVLKQKADAPPDMFLREADGLAALAQPGGPRLPAVSLTGPDFLLLEDLRPAPPGANYWPRFGEQLALLHMTTHPRYGFAHDNYCGETQQPNDWTESGHAFFAEHRLRYQARLARDRQRLDSSELEAVESLCRRLPDLIPPQSPALIHGDLWSGNALTGPEGEPALIDPAAYFGWAEAELGMTLLFGGFPPAFYDAYAAVYPLATGWRGRLDIYNLYHLLNHLNLFGGSYLGQVQAILRRYR